MPDETAPDEDTAIRRDGARDRLDRPAADTDKSEAAGTETDSPEAGGTETGNPNQERSPNDSDPSGAVGIPGDTGPNPPSMPGTSEAARPVQGVYRPDVGPGGEDIDTGDRSLAGRGRQSRGPLSDRP